MFKNVMILFFKFTKLKNYDSLTEKSNIHVDQKTPNDQTKSLIDGLEPPASRLKTTALFMSMKLTTEFGDTNDLQSTAQDTGSKTQHKVHYVIMG